MRRNKNSFNSQRGGVSLCKKGRRGKWYGVGVFFFFGRIFLLERGGTSYYYGGNEGLPSGVNPNPLDSVAEFPKIRE